MVPIRNAAPLRGHTVLVVEDEALLALDMADEVERAGGEVEMAASSRQALRLIETRQFDAAILDFQLLDGDSLPVAAELSSRNVPFFFVTAQARLRQIRDTHPSTAIFDKPMMPDLMRVRLQEMLEGHRACA